MPTITKNVDTRNSLTKIEIMGEILM